MRVDAGHFQLRLAMVVASFLFAAERPLCLGEAFEAFLQVLRVFDHGALAGDGERVHAQVKRYGVAFPAEGRDAFLDEDAHMPALRWVKAHGHRGGFRAFRQGPRPGYRQWFLQFGETQLASVPFERAPRVFGGTAARLLLERGVGVLLFEETGERPLQMAQGLLEGHAGHVVEERQPVGLLPIGEHAARIRIGHVPFLAGPSLATGFQRLVVYEASAAECTPEQALLFRRRIKAEPVCPLKFPTLGHISHYATITCERRERLVSSPP